MNFQQLAILFLQGTLVSFVILLLFKLRKKLGLGMLFACLGLFQFMQVFLSSTVYVSITDNLLVSPGSTVLFTATLFALLIIYMKEDAGETRKIIYALLIVNVVMSVFIESFSWNLNGAAIYNPFNVSTQLFSNSAWVLFVGTVALLLDAILIIIIYEFVSRHLRSIFLQILLTMLVVVAFDTLFFSLAAFGKSESLKVILVSGFISKGAFTIFYSVLFYIYLRYIDSSNRAPKLFNITDVFDMLTYKQKFETANVDIKKVSEELETKDIHYKTLTDISPVGVFQARSDGYTTFVNKRWCEISGMKSEDGLGWGWLASVHPDDLKSVKEEWDLALVQKRMSEVNYRFILPDGSTRWVLGQAVPINNNQNEMIGFVGTTTDITELKMGQQEQVLLRKKADESNQLKTKLLENLSHEIRTPMNGILGFSGLLKDPNLSSESLQDYIKIISMSGMRMLNLLNNIVSISKIESGDVEVKSKDLIINDEYEKLYELFKAEAQEKNLGFAFKRSLSLVYSRVRTDRTKFISIFSNLIRNAIKYTESGAIEFGCTVKGDFFEFYVKDTGVGILKEKRAAIFETFVQADTQSATTQHGVGLGLSISKKHVETLGGKIWVESEIGKGSVFYFTLPCVMKRKERKAENIPALRDKFEHKAKELKILVVEDDEISNLLIDELLSDIECEVVHAENGAKAIAICENTTDLDLVLMDIKMPVMDGYEATRRIRKFNKDVIIVAQTAHALSGDKERSIEAGCNEYLSKPISKERISTILHNYFNK